MYVSLCLSLSLSVNLSISLSLFPLSPRARVCVRVRMCMFLRTNRRRSLLNNNKEQQTRRIVARPREHYCCSSRFVGRLASRSRVRFLEFFSPVCVCLFWLVFLFFFTRESAKSSVPPVRECRADRVGCRIVPRSLSSQSSSRASPLRELGREVCRMSLDVLGRKSRAIESLRASGSRRPIGRTNFCRRNILWSANDFARYSELTGKLFRSFVRAILSFRTSIPIK